MRSPRSRKNPNIGTSDRVTAPPVAEIRTMLSHRQADAANRQGQACPPAYLPLPAYHILLLAFWVSWSVQARRVLDGPVWQILGGVTLLAVWGLAIWWTYAPPQLPLFVDPTDGSRGIPLR